MEYFLYEVLLCKFLAILMDYARYPQKRVVFRKLVTIHISYFTFLIPQGIALTAFYSVSKYTLKSTYSSGVLTLIDEDHFSTTF